MRLAEAHARQGKENHKRTEITMSHNLNPLQHIGNSVVGRRASGQYRRGPDLETTLCGTAEPLVSRVVMYLLEKPHYD